MRKQKKYMLETSDIETVDNLSSQKIREYSTWMLYISVLILIIANMSTLDEAYRYDLFYGPIFNFFLMYGLVGMVVTPFFYYRGDKRTYYKKKTSALSKALGESPLAQTYEVKKSIFSKILRKSFFPKGLIDEKTNIGWTMLLGFVYFPWVLMGYLLLGLFIFFIGSYNYLIVAVPVFIVFGIYIIKAIIKAFNSVFLKTKKEISGIKQK